MIVCIIGCTGYLGSRISSHLSKNGYQIIGVCRKFPKKNKNFKNSFLKIIEGDISDKKTQNKIFSSNFNSIIYTVSLNHKDSEIELNNSLKINYLPLLDIATKIVKEKLDVKFIYFSTMQVYGNYTKKRIINESMDIQVNNTYALTHLMCENVLSSLSNHSSIQSTSLRLSNGYGYPELKSCDCWWLVINDFCQNIENFGEIRINSDGSPLRDFIHISDIANAVERLIKSKKNLPKVINLASGKTLSMLDIANLVREEFLKKKYDPTIYIQNKKITDKELSRRIKFLQKLPRFKISNKLADNMGIVPKISIREGISDTLEKLRNKY